MSEEPLVSIIINNYNYARFLLEAIDSALCQTFQLTEVIVVDDGSTDQSPDMICGYGKRVTSILKKNGGQASALNAGFAASRGDLVIFLDADDILLPHAVQQVVDSFRADTALVKVQYRMEVIGEDGQRTGVIKPACHIPMPGGDLRRQELLFPFDLAWQPTSGNVIASRTLRQIFPIPEYDYGCVGADWYLSHLTPLFGPVRSLDKVCALYRVHTLNNYELTRSTLDLGHVRQTILYSDHTVKYLKKFADQLGLPERPQDILSVSYMANRLISFKLESEHHPIAGDTLWKVLRLSAIAISRRFDVSWSMKCLFGLWFTLIILAPKSMARWLSEVFLFPEKRKRLNSLLGAMHRSS